MPPASRSQQCVKLTSPTLLCLALGLPTSQLWGTGSTAPLSPQCPVCWPAWWPWWDHRGSFCHPTICDSGHQAQRYVRVLWFCICCLVLENNSLLALHFFKRINWNNNNNNNFENYFSLKTFQLKDTTDRWVKIRCPNCTWETEGWGAGGSSFPDNKKHQETAAAKMKYWLILAKSQTPTQPLPHSTLPWDWEETEEKQDWCT